MLCRFGPALNPHPGADPPHDTVLDIGDASDTAALGLGGDDRIGGGNGGLGAGDERSDFGFVGAQFRQFRLGGIAIAKRGAPSSLRFRRGYGGQAAGYADFAGTFGAASGFG